MSNYADNVFTDLGKYSENRKPASQSVGVSQEAIAGAIAEEWNDRKFIFDLFQDTNVRGRILNSTTPSYPGGIVRFKTAHDFVLWSYKEIVKDGKTEGAGIFV